jgi:hypothetical protein
MRLNISIIIILILISACGRQLSTMGFTDTWINSMPKSTVSFMGIQPHEPSDSFGLLTYNMSYSYLSPPNYPFRSSGVLYTQKNKCVAFDTVYHKKFVLFDFSAKQGDTLKQNAVWEVYPAILQITLDTMEYIPIWKDTIYKFRYIDMSWEYVGKKRYRGDWVWCVSKKNGIYGIYFDFFRAENSYTATAMGKFPQHWHITSLVPKTTVK